MKLIEYEQDKTVVNMHRAPRFGHSSNIALLASQNQDEQSDYARGVMAFCFFNLFIIFLWGAVLIVLKALGPSKVGCAAGGDVLDYPLLKKEYDRPTRKKIERRSWRVQSAFLIASILLFPACGLFLRKGLFQVGESLDKLYDINDSIQRVMTQAYDITKSLKREQSRVHSADVDALLHLDKFCPNAVNNTVSNTTLQALNLPLIGETIQASFQELNTFIDTYVAEAQIGLQRVREASDSVDETIIWFQENEWKPRLLILILIVMNSFLLIGLMLSRNDIAYNPYICLLAYFLVPVFSVCLVLSSVATYGFGGAALMNADICAGGEYPGSLEGTIEDVIRQRGVNQQGLVYQSFRYYMDGCSTENPLAFIEDYLPKIKYTMDAADMLLISAEEHGLANLTESCAADVVPVVSAVALLKGSLQSIQDNVNTAVDLSSCYSISPILRRIFYGPTCTDTVSGLTWMFSCCLAISILGLTMLSVRAALYNATLRPKRKPRTPRQIEQEWNEYKNFMADFYPDVDEWEFHTSPEKKDLQEIGSYDTDITESQSNDTETDNGEIPYVSDEDDSDLGVFMSPEKSVEKELEPLTPLIISNRSTPPAPKKPFTSFRRTSLGTWKSK